VSLDALLDALASAPRWQDRVVAVNALARIDADRARNALVWALYDDGDDAVVEAAAEAMIASNDERFVTPLVDALERAEDHKSDVIWDCVCRHAGDRIADDVRRRHDE
jgi:HEAT repeat protein